jgi:hypothetical protein
VNDPLKSSTITNISSLHGFSPTKMKIGRLTFGQGSDSATLNIQNDITVLESANLAVLLSTMTINMQGTYSQWDWEGYIKEKELQRHFDREGGW